jgi:hypothetical protein
MAKVKVAEPIKAIGLARQAAPTASAAQQRALADQILKLNNQQRGQAFGAGESVRLGAGVRIPQQSAGTPPRGEFDDVRLSSPATFSDFTPPADDGVTGQISEGTSGYTSAAPAPAATQWTLESDPVYQQAMAGGQSAFNVARAQALAGMQNQQSEAARAERDISKGAASSRERLAGNFAARGMAGGAYGALTRAEAEANARQVTAQTDIKDQMAALSQQYLANFGATGTDWTGTLVGQDYRNQAIQQAMSALMPRYTGV